MQYHIITFGCQMNKSDSERIRSVFDHLGMNETVDVKNADIVVINACSVRQTAIDRIWGLLKEFKKEGHNIKLIKVLTGCLLPEDKVGLGARFDLVFDIKELWQLEKFLHKKVAKMNTDYLKNAPKYTNDFQAFVPIMTGCNNFCSYCAVPYARGREVSRPVKDVIDEIKKLADNGCKEIQLLGQNVNSYNPDDLKSFSKKNPFQHNFARLLWEVNKIKGIQRIFFVSSHPKDMADEVIQALTLPKMVNYIHLALQSGDNDILRSMNRKYTTEQYYKIIEKIRKVRPDMAIGTDIIVGFPGETRKQFLNTIKFYKKVKFDVCYHSMYSPRSGTKAAELEDNVTEEEKKRRWHELHEVMKPIALAKNKKYEGQVVSVLIDKKEKKYCEGYNLEMKRVRIDNYLNKVGEIVDVKIKKVREWMIFA